MLETKEIKNQTFVSHVHVMPNFLYAFVKIAINDCLCSLTKGNVLHELVNMVVTEPSNDLEYQVRFKHASLASELLSAEVPAIVDKLAASEDLLNTLCKWVLFVVLTYYREDLWFLLFLFFPNLTVSINNLL